MGVADPVGMAVNPWEADVSHGRWGGGGNLLVLAVAGKQGG